MILHFSTQIGWVLFFYIQKLLFTGLARYAPTLKSDQMIFHAPEYYTLDVTNLTFCFKSSVHFNKNLLLI